MWSSTRDILLCVDHGDLPRLLLMSRWRKSAWICFFLLRFTSSPMIDILEVLNSVDTGCSTVLYLAKMPLLDPSSTPGSIDAPH